MVLGELLHIGMIREMRLIVLLNSGNCWEQMLTSKRDKIASIRKSRSSPARET